MTNNDVIALTSAGMSDDIIFAKIHAATSTSFDTSIAGLQALKAGGVSSAVIKLMISPNAAVTPQPATPSTLSSENSDDPTQTHSPGIYMFAKKSGDNTAHLTKLEHTAPKQSKTSGVFLSGITYGIKKAHIAAVIDGASASVKTSETEPVFYAYIPEDNSSFGGSSITIKDFALIKFDVKNDVRQVNTVSASAWGASAGTDKKARQGFTSEVIKPGIYKLALVQALPPGEYAFQQSGTQGTKQGENTGSYFDFSIYPEK